MRWALVLSLSVLGCRPPVQLGGVLVKITLEPGTPILCVEVTAQTLDERVVETVAVPTGNKSELSIGVAENERLAGRARITVKGFTDASCRGIAAIQLPAQESAFIPDPLSSPLFFTFRGSADGGTDAGLLVDAGMTDAGARVDAGVDAGTDAGPPCDLSTCFSANECERATCSDAGVCERGLRMAGAPCDAGLCSAAGQCLPPNACTPGQPCDPMLPCTSTGICSTAGACVPSFTSCTVPACQRRIANAMQCAPDGGCPVETDPNTRGDSCGPDQVCYANGLCRPILDSSNVDAWRAPWPTSPLEFQGPCRYVWNTTPGAVGDPLPAGGGLCTWPVGARPVLAANQTGNGPQVVVFTASSLRVAPNAEVQFVGRRAVVMQIHGDALIEGFINLRPIDETLPGAGADSTACQQGQGSVGNQGDREGGGGGGFREAGGSGGRIGNNGGSSNGNDTLTPLRGGCSGGAGIAAADGGLAGGALQLSVLGTLRIVDGGTIAAPGLGGPGGLPNRPGSGGGSGGAILLQARSLVLSNAYVTANGGSGGQGGNGSVPTGPRPGNSGLAGALQSAQVASGGQGGNCCGGLGGAGGAGTTRPTGGADGDTSGNNTPSGGGGGGSQGRIRLEVVRAGGTCTLDQPVISPTPSQGSFTMCL